jgi:lysophospholipase L1-like esterase
LNAPVGRLTIVVMLTASLSGCTPLMARLEGSQAVSPPAANLHALTQLTALGDSVPYGTACHCIPYPGLTARDLSHVAHHEVTTRNRAVPGYTTVDVLRQVEYSKDVRRDIVHSQAVTVEIGANDVAHSAKCGNDLSCYEARLPNLRRHLDGIVYTIRLLTSRHPVTLVLLDYWNVWLDGKYGAAHGSAYVRTSRRLTAKVSETVRSIAKGAGGYWVDLQTAFRGPDRAWDTTHLLAPDGDHPNAAGHGRISQAIEHTIAVHA